MLLFFYSNKIEFNKISIVHSYHSINVYLKLFYNKDLKFIDLCPIVKKVSSMLDIFYIDKIKVVI